ncbi:molybdenum cofactor biosynthesis protein B [Caulobacter vibrioides]|uniref:Molybdenum cofactor biosynthesis protein B n=2 Tax=Caulobacter vibrioides TaxID=155892 RepID=Q9AC51_CAUVC|nr:molybdenum cofactor biosynthesis protein B [Caulobacter vibrioides]YP_002515390.1 molybdenum cofactor biosynthesis protein B [Caulobacter vibrioides NA1000]AAK22003.1 molybdenum cofactor biosynthesis protein B [Caulobacter vibrioides CB15]ACL93482.1 molybdenum cofactor biosynthesis protein B [Caulobacter vibrioides NA1000]ATC26853.1 molybdenum cofactor biosynthesis protein B [Caulobacter vibrioides]QXZ52111.1 molybdenum cofactor biosynthesis protein B [Caulobacter vibrioides]
MSEALKPGGGIKPDLPFTPVRVAVLTITDTRDEASDTSGQILVERIKAAGHELGGRVVVRDDIEQIRAQVRSWIDSKTVDAIVTTGGTGLTGRDVTVEALEPLFDKKIDGFSVVFHLVSYASVGLSTLQSRATAGLIESVFVFCLPGSNGAVKDGWDKVIAAQLDSRHKPCNMVELMPRLLER